MSTAPQEDDPSGRRLIDSEEGLRGLSEPRHLENRCEKVSTQRPSTFPLEHQPEPAVSAGEENYERHLTDQSYGS